MVNNLELIEAYFNEELSAEKKSEFERRITEDPFFAEETAFYLSSRQAAAAELQENRARLRRVYEQYKQGKPADVPKQSPVRKLWPWVAAAAVLAGIILGWYIFFQPATPLEMADSYIAENFQNLPVQMGGRDDSMQAALRLYNDGKSEEALNHFESMIARDTSFAEAKKFAGIVSLRLGQYEKAISYFSRLENQTHLYSNPGKFYHALTLMKRNRPGDKQEAKVMMEQVVKGNLEGREIARKWLRKW